MLQALDPKASELGVALARYTVVRAAGYLEAVRDDVADLFVSRIAVDLVSNRIRSGLRAGQGVRPGQLIEFVQSFHPEWAVEITDFLDDDSVLRNRRSDLGALVNARKKIAHGDGDAVTPPSALRWAATAEEVGGWIIKRFDPGRDFYSRVSTTV
jgi:hypothetical protein